MSIRAVRAFWGVAIAGLIGVGLATGGGGFGCDFGVSEFKCTAAMECPASDGLYGICADNHCAFVDKSCATGWRWDQTAGSEAKMCVDTAKLPDAGMGGPDAAPKIDGGPSDAAAAADAPPAIDAKPAPPG